MAAPEPVRSPEQVSKEMVEAEYWLIAGQSEHFGWKTRLEDVGDDDIVYVRIPKPNGRTFVLRLECDDYPRQAPLATFANPDGWGNAALRDEVKPEYWPTGQEYLADRSKPHKVMCIRGHREYYENNWHAGWTNPPARQDTIYQLVVNVRHAILDRWA